MVCAELAIPDCDFSNNAAYLSSWLEKLRSDRKEIFRAAADAQRIADYLLGFHPDFAGRSDATPTNDGGSEDGLVAGDPLAEAA